MKDNGIVKTESPKPQVRVGQSGLVPSNFEGLWRMATMVANSAFAPKGMSGQPENCMVAMAHGLEVGLGPMQAVQRIAVINGRPAIWGDAMVGLVQASGLMVKFVESFDGDPFEDDYKAVCCVRRKEMDDEACSTYSVADAKRAGLWGKGGPWTQYPKRMLQMRARGFALRDNFADVLGGLYMAEELGAVESFDPDKMQGKPANLPTLETVYSDDDAADADKPVIELIDEEPEIDPDTGEVVGECTGEALFGEGDEQKGYV